DRELGRRVEAVAARGTCLSGSRLAHSLRPFQAHRGQPQEELVELVVNHSSCVAGGDPAWASHPRVPPGRRSWRGGWAVCATVPELPTLQFRETVRYESGPLLAQLGRRSRARRAAWRSAVPRCRSLTPC